MAQIPGEEHVFSSWASDYKGESSKAQNDKPDYYIGNTDLLISEANVHAFVVGTGESIFDQLQPTIDSIDKELILITCYWASSESQKIINQCLRRLSEKALKHGHNKIRVFIGLSSLSLSQKLFQTSSLSGYTYPPSEWTSKLELPSIDDLTGLDMTIKSIFVLPFSVMHPKFMIADRKMVCLPSYNISWENWFEGAIIMSGPIVQKFVEFWENFWADSKAPFEETQSIIAVPDSSQSSPNVLISSFPPNTVIKACFLPSPHHTDPQFRPLWFQSPSPPRHTPLNHFLQSHIALAQTQIYVQTPNLTCMPLIQDLITALARGVNVHIITSESLMIWEQVVTAGTLTTWCVNRLVKSYQAVVQAAQRRDEESGLREPGILRIEWFTPREGEFHGEPVQSHIKVSIFDERIVVLGSGNMDRASWYTSQELGVAFYSKELALTVQKTLQNGLSRRTKVRYDSTA
jgi:phosphatidylserine/phosphatidylglycerophosphate/cardiolipin synthase-like enzyme